MTCVLDLDGLVHREGYETHSNETKEPEQRHKEERDASVCWEWVTWTADGGSPKPPCRLCHTWVSGSWKPHFPDSCTPEPLGLKNRHTLTWLRTWVHTPGASASSGAKSGCWGILVGVVAAVSAPGTDFGGDGRRDRWPSLCREGTWQRQCGLGVQTWLPALCLHQRLMAPLVSSPELVSWESFLGVQLESLPQNFPMIFILHPVESSSAYICYLNLPETNCRPCRWHSAAPRVVMGIWLEESGLLTSFA